MVQNHMLPAAVPGGDGAALATSIRTSVRNEKVKVIRSRRLITDEDAERTTVRGQYVSGTVEGKRRSRLRRGTRIGQRHRDLRRHPRGHRQLALGRLAFFLRTGKRLPEKRTEIVIQFKPVPHSIFGQDARDEDTANRMVIELQPEEDISLTCDEQEARPRSADAASADPDVPVLGRRWRASKPPRRRIAYERLLLDALERGLEPVRAS